MSGVMIELDPSLLTKLDRFVSEQVFSSRSDAVALALKEKLDRMETDEQFLTECDKLDPADEQALAEEWLEGERDLWAKS